MTQAATMTEQVARAIWNTSQDHVVGDPGTYALKMRMSWDEAQRAAHNAITALQGSTALPIQDTGALSGSHTSTEPCGLGPPGFDPARWLLIETAPHNGEHILACIAGTSFGFVGKRWPAIQTVVHWWANPGEEGFYTSVNETEPQRPFGATHWKPLDEPEGTF